MKHPIVLVGTPPLGLKQALKEETLEMRSTPFLNGIAQTLVAMASDSLDLRPGGKRAPKLRELKASPTYLTIKTTTPLTEHDVVLVEALVESCVELAPAELTNLRAELLQRLFKGSKQNQIVLGWSHRSIVLTKRRKSYILNDGETRHKSDNPDFYWVVTLK